MLYSIRSERLLMEEIDFGMLFRWFSRHASRSEAGALVEFLVVSPRKSPPCTYAGRTFPEDTEQRLPAAS